MPLEVDKKSFVTLEFDFFVSLLGEMISAPLFVVWLCYPRNERTDVGVLNMTSSDTSPEARTVAIRILFFLGTFFSAEC